MAFRADKEAYEDLVDLKFSFIRGTVKMFFLDLSV